MIADGVYLKEEETCRLMKSEFINFFAHFHQQVEILYCAKGSQHVLIDGIGYDLQAGDVVAIFPNQRHHYEPSAKGSGKELYLLLFEPAFTDSLYEEWLNKRPDNSVVRKERLPDFYEDLWIQMYEMYNSTPGPDTAPEPDTEPETEPKPEPKPDPRLIKGYASLLSAYILVQLDLKEGKFTTNQGDMQTVLNYVNRYFQEKLTLASTAKTLGFSTTGLSKLFSEQIGCSFSEYLNLQRTKKAKRLLKSSRLSVEMVGVHSGFQSRRSFFRNFYKICGESPAEYRQKLSPH